METLAIRPDKTPRVPLMSSDHFVSFVEEPEPGEDDSTVWEWFAPGIDILDQRIADSFGSYLSQLADMMEDGRVIEYGGIASFYDDVFDGGF